MGCGAYAPNMSSSILGLGGGLSLSSANQTLGLRQALPDFLGGWHLVLAKINRLFPIMQSLLSTRVCCCRVDKMNSSNE